MSSVSKSLIAASGSIDPDPDTVSEDAVLSLYFDPQPDPSENPIPFKPLLRYVSQSDLVPEFKNRISDVVKMLVRIGKLLFPPTYLLNQEIKKKVLRYTEWIEGYLEAVIEHLGRRIRRTEGEVWSLPSPALDEEQLALSIAKWTEVVEYVDTPSLVFYVTQRCHQRYLLIFYVMQKCHQPYLLIFYVTQKCHQPYPLTIQSLTAFNSTLHAPTDREQYVFREVSDIFSSHVYSPFLQLHRIEPGHNMWTLEPHFTSISLLLRQAATLSARADEAVRSIEEKFESTMSSGKQNSDSTESEADDGVLGQSRRNHTPSKSAPLLLPENGPRLSLSPTSRQRENTI